MRFLSFARVAALALSFIVAPAFAVPEPEVERNVVYGMVSGAALLLDVHKPAQPNGIGILFIPGSSWAYGRGYGAEPLTASSQVRTYMTPLTKAGYTVFVINYRGLPAFQYPACVQDTQRAVRFIRHNAARFGIDPARIGGVGGSSGAHLIGLMGTLDGAGDPADADLVNRESAKLQAVVARAMPADLTQHVPVALLGITDSLWGSKEALAVEKAASPLSQVTSGSAPFLLIHGDADRSVPFEDSVRMEAALTRAGVPAKLLRIPGGIHHPTFRGAVNPPDFMGAMVQWLDLYLRKKDAPDAQPTPTQTM